MITVRAVLTPAQGDTLEGVELFVYTFAYSGSAQLVGTGKPDSRGTVAIGFDFAAGAYQPRIQLRFRRGGTTTPVELTEDVKTFLKEVADFGTLTLPPANPDNLTTPATETSLLNVLQQTGLQVKQAQDALRGTGLQVGKVALQLKVMPASTSGNVLIPNVDDLARVSRRGLSQVNFEFDTLASGATSTTPEKVVPPLLNLTEVLARRKLAEQQLEVEVVYQRVDAEEHVGRVRMQRPAAKTAVQPGTVVTLAIGRKE